MHITIIGNGEYGENLYKVCIGTGTAWLEEFRVYAYNETEAIDLIADYCEKNGLDGLYADHYEIFDLCNGETVEEYAEAHNLTCCGNHGIYLEIASIELVK